MSDRLEEVIRFAVEKEKAAERYYRDWAARAKDSAVSRTFEEFAAEERRHVERLDGVSVDELERSGRAVADFGLAELMEDVPPREDMTVAEALALAVRREQRAIDLYERLRRYATDEDALFDALAAEERRHKHRLELEYARVARGHDAALSGGPASNGL